MNQGKLEVVKQEVVRVNINILGIRETGTGKAGGDETADYGASSECRED